MREKRRGPLLRVQCGSRDERLRRTVGQQQQQRQPRGEINNWTGARENIDFSPIKGLFRAFVQRRPRELRPRVALIIAPTCLELLETGATVRFYSVSVSKFHACTAAPRIDV